MDSSLEDEDVLLKAEVLLAGAFVITTPGVPLPRSLALESSRFTPAKARTNGAIRQQWFSIKKIVSTSSDAGA